MKDRPIYVPIALDVLVVGADAPAPADLAPNYDNLDDIPLGQFAVNTYFTVGATEQPGAYLHWILPDALLQGAHQPETVHPDGGVTPARLVFPAVPNRWIVQRLHTEGQTLGRKAWIVESDYVGQEPQPGLEGTHTTLPTFAFDGDKGRWVGAGPDGDIYGFVGHCRSYGQPPPQGGSYLPRLTAVGAGDPAFAAFFPKCRTVFGFYDDLRDVPAASVSYLVTGYYARPEDDPLNSPTPEILADLGWQLEDEALPDSTLCHGLTTGVNWQGPQAVYASGIPPKNIEVYIGNTSGEALSTLLQDKLPEAKGLERMLNALQCDYLQGLANDANPDVLLELESLLHQKQFSHEENRGQWRLRSNANAARPVALAEGTYQKIFALNRQEKEQSAAQQLAHSLKKEIYFTWFRFLLVNGDHRQKARAVAVTPQDYIGQIQAYIRQLKEVNAQIDGHKKAIETLQNELGEVLEKSLMQLDKTQPDRFYTPNPPVIMMTGEGVQRSFKQGFQANAAGVLPCRIKTLESLGVPLEDQTVPVDRKCLWALYPNCGQDLPEPLAALTLEGILLSPDCSGPIARAAYTGAGLSYDEQRLAETAAKIRQLQAQQAGFSGPMPFSLALRPWQNPWSPLLMEWQFDVTPARKNVEADDGFRPFTLGKLDYEWREDEPPQEPGRDDVIAVLGSTLITPHAALHLCDMIQKLIKDFGQAGFDYTSLEKAARRCADMDVLSQRVDGFHEQLVMQDNLPFLNLYCDENEDPELVQLVAEMTGLLDIPFTSPVLKPDATDFLAVRAGGISLSRLWLVDSFGRIKEISTTETNVHYAENLKDPRRTGGGLLRPRFLQPCTLDFRWLAWRQENANGDQAPMEAMDPFTSPVFGFIQPNILDRNLQIYDDSGILQGVLQWTDGGAVWQNSLVGGVKAEDIPGSHLRRFVLRLLQKDSTALADLLAYLDDVLAAADPAVADSFRQRCFGRVLALARARVQVYGKGLPPYVQWWRTERSCNGFDTEPFYVRVGDKRKLDDGLVGFFVGNDADATYTKMHILQEGPPSDYFTWEDGFCTSLTGGATGLSLLLDPAGQVTVQTGFLPQYTTGIDPAYFAQPLDNMEMICRYAPILGRPEQLEALVPADPDVHWRLFWLNEEEETESADPIQPSVLPPVQRVQVIEGYLKSKYKKESTREGTNGNT